MDDPIFPQLKRYCKRSIYAIFILLHIFPTKVHISIILDFNYIIFQRKQIFSQYAHCRKNVNNEYNIDTKLVHYCFTIRVNN